ncbi:MAG: proton-conducting transporter membrane subunit [Planctomycetota bacterium]
MLDVPQANSTAPSGISSGSPASAPGKLGNGLLALLTFAALGGLIWQIATPEPLRFAGLIVDRLSTTLGLLVASVGWIVLRYARRYLDGDPKRGVFLTRLTLTVVSAYGLMFANHLLLLFAVWLLTSVNLHALLTHYDGRIEAFRASRKKFLISRLGDLALLAAIVLAYVTWNTLDISQLKAMVAAGQSAGMATPFMLLIALAALTKSAQFPFHSWLPETMESPTPVSALMHAGVINAGGALLLRFAPILIEVPAALALLVAIGTLTATLGVLAMWTQTNIKRTLAWSTVAQMGLMMIQVGLGVFAAAALHIVAHGAYKAWNFLRSGDVPAPAASLPKRGPGWTLSVAAIGTVAAVPALLAASWLFSFELAQSPGKVALVAILALAAGQLWVVALRAGRSVVHGLGMSIGLTAGGAALAVGLYAGCEWLLGTVFVLDPALPGVGWSGVSGWLVAALPVVAVAALVVLHALLPVIGHRRWGRVWYVHALHGFYFGAIADRFVAWVWPGKPTP